jgi:hypothetical protein
MEATMTALRCALPFLLVTSIAPAITLAQTPETTPATETTAVPDTPAVPDTTATTGVPPVEVRYEKGFVLATLDEKFEIKAGIRSQTRIESLRSDAGEELLTRFMIPRLRLQLEGFAFGKANSYKVEFDMANKGYSLLKDWYVDHAYSPGLHIRAGQWKRPFSRMEIVSDFGSEFLERSIANEFGGGGRDLGIAVHNDYEKSPEGIEWAAGLFNGTGEKPLPTAAKCEDPTDPETCTIGTPTNVPPDFGPMLVLRVGWNKGKIKGYSEGDLEGGALRFAVGASYKVNFKDLEKQDLDADGEEDSLLEHAVEADFIVKVNGFDLSGAVYLVKNNIADAEVGFYGQAGLFVLPKAVQVCGRFAMVPSEVPDENDLEVLAAFNWYWQGHNMKWMTDAGILKTTGVDGQDVQIRSQIQLVF